jgi:hypothetical protein
VTNSSSSESNANIKLKAPQAYYTQNRMITAEDYNIAPLTVDSDILKVKSVNRVASGISKYYELSDVSGKYSNTNIFANDGILYKEDNEYNFEFTFATRNEILTMIKNQLAPIIGSPAFKSFYLSQYPQITLDPTAYPLAWNLSNKTTNQSRGYFNTDSVPTSLGDYASGALTFFKPGALLKLVPPQGQYFKPNGRLTSTQDDTTRSYRWVQIVNVTGDGSNSGAGNLADGTGPVILTGLVDGKGLLGNSSRPSEVIPKFQNVLSYALETEIANLSLSKRNFGLSFDSTTRSWYIINDANIDLKNSFSLLFQQDVSNANKDASWMVSFEWTGKKYVVRYRVTEYVFESDKETAFFIDKSKKNYDFVTDTVIKDKITVLGINKQATTSTALSIDYTWQVDTAVIEPDGYVEPKKVLVSFFDYNDDGQIDDPDTFNNIVQPATTSTQTTYKDKFVYFEKLSDGLRYSMYDGEVLAYPTEDDVLVGEKEDGQLYYFYDSSMNVVKRYSSTTGGFILEPSYYARSGRSNLKFHYAHNSGEARRIDPSKSSIIDVYLLTKAYDLEYRNWLAGGTGNAPLPPTTQSLEENYSSTLEPIKAISDELIYHPVNYKVLFGSQAETPLQATFKAVINPARTVSTTDLQTRILAAIEDFFTIENWDFGQTFNFGELSTYVMNRMTPDITNFVIVPKMDSSFGSLYQITCASNEIFVSGTTVNDIQIIDSLTASELKAASTIVTSS